METTPEADPGTETPDFRTEEAQLGQRLPLPLHRVVSYLRVRFSILFLFPLSTPSAPGRLTTYVRCQHYNKRGRYFFQISNLF